MKTKKLLVDSALSLLKLDFLEMIYFYLINFTQRPPKLYSPEVNSDSSITFRYYSNSSKSIMLDAEFLSAPKTMVKESSGVWSVIIDPFDTDLLLMG